MKRSVALVSAWIVILLLATAAHGETGGRLIGYVVDENQDPLPGAVISVTGTGAVGIYTATSDERGWYAVVGLPLHEPLIVRGRAPGKVPKVYAGIGVKEGGDVRRDFCLRPPDHHELLVLLDPDLPSHVLALAGLRATFDGHIATVEVKGTTMSDERRVREQILRQPNVVAAFGENAARIARREGRQVPVVFTLVPDPRGDKLLTSNTCGVALNGGYAAQLDRLKEIAPDARTVVTVFDPRELAPSVRNLRKEAIERGLELVSLPVRNRRHLERALENLADQPADAFFLLFDPDFFDESKLAMIERFVEQEDLIYIVPDASLLGTDEAFTSAPGFHAMGERTGRLILQMLQDQEMPMQLGVVFPEARDFVVQRSAK